MKKNALIAFLLVLSCTLFAQDNYKYVIIPTQFSGIGSGLNPYGLSSSTMKVFSDKNIKTVFKTDALPDDYCDALTVELEKLPNMFRSKLKVSLKDCMSRIIWTGEGMGRSKEFVKGYAEAVEAALKDLDELPTNKTQAPQQAKAATQIPLTPLTKAKEVQTKVIKATPLVPATKSTKAISNDASQRIYKPGNLFYNYSYFVDLIEDENGSKEIMLINGKILGYDDLQIIAKLSPSGLENVLTVEWTNLDGTTTNGVANLSENILKISLGTGDKQSVISLQKY